MKPDVRREAQRWVQSLTSPEEGYRVIVSYDCFVSLVHTSNGNRIRIYVREDYAELLKNGVVVKTYHSQPFYEPTLF